jgi:hypothetical protein
MQQPNEMQKSKINSPQTQRKLKEKVVPSMSRPPLLLRMHVKRALLWDEGVFFKKKYVTNVK